MLEMDVISWPDASERRTISKHFQDKNEFSNGIGLVDLAVFSLVFKPIMCGEEYWYHKVGYTIHCLIICGVERMLFPGFVHDNHVWFKTDQYNHHYDYFSCLQCLLQADSAFIPSVHLIAALLLHSRGFMVFESFLKIRMF